MIYYSSAMSKKDQGIKNLDLFEKLMNFLSSKKIDEYSSGDYSFVVFSKKDKQLNEENKKLVIGLKKEGKKVIKAEETGNSKSPWNFVQA